MILKVLHEKLATRRSQVLGLTITHRSGAVVFGLSFLATGCRAQSNESASSELIRANPTERSVAELICLVQDDELQIRAGTGAETPELPRCNSKIRDEFLRKFSGSSSRSDWAEVAVIDIPKKGRFYWGLLPGIETEVFIRATSHGPKKGIATHYLHPVTGHWTEI